MGFAFADRSFGGRAPFSRRVNLTKLEVKRHLGSGQDIFTTEHSYNQSGYSYGSPTQTKTYSNISTSPRITNTSYEHKKLKWIVGLPNVTTINGRQMVDYNYDNYGRAIQEKRYGYLYAAYDYNDASNQDGTLKWAKDALLQKTSYNQWKRGTPQVITKAAGTSDQITIKQFVDNNGWLSSSVDPKNNSTAYSYDRMGRLKSINPPLYSSTYINYTFPSSGVTQTITRGTRTETLTYDSMLRPILSNVGGEIYVKTAYNTAGQVKFKSFPSSASNPSNGTDFTYDPLGRLLTSTKNVTPYSQISKSYHAGHRNRITDADGSFKDYYMRGYDGADGNSVSQIKAYNASYQLQRTTRINKNVWEELESVNQFGNLGGFNANKTQSFKYDRRRRLCSYYAPEQGATRYGYDVGGRLTSYSKGHSNSSGCRAPTGATLVTLQYDNLNRLETTDFTDNNTPDITRTYDDNSNVETVNREGVNWLYAYNDENHLTAETLSLDGKSYALAYDYDGHGRLNWRSLPSGMEVDFTHDALGRQSSVKYDNDNIATNINWHPGGAAIGFRYGNGFQYTKEINALLQPVQVSSIKSRKKAFNRSYTYNDRGLMATLTDHRNSRYNQTFSYDGLQQLKAASGRWGAGSFEYDSIGNIREKKLGSRVVNMRYNGQNRLSSYSDSGAGPDKTLSYDSRGNVTTLGDLSFVYDMAGQPRSVVETEDQTPPTTGGGGTITLPPSGGGLPPTDCGNPNDPFPPIHCSIGGGTYEENQFPADNTQPFSSGNTAQNAQSILGTYHYDGNFKRVKSDINGVIIYNVYDASGTLVHVDERTDNKKTDYVHGAGVTLARIKNGDVTYLHNDHIGSAATGTNDNGDLLWTQRYTPFGEEWTNVGANDDQAGFTGHIKDAATGLNYMQARYYDPVIGRFLSIDPVTFMDTGDPGYFNRYAYTMNDPINLIDPDGRQSSSPGNQGGCSGYGNGCTGVRNSDGTYSFKPNGRIPAGNAEGMTNVVGALTLGMGGVGRSGSSALGQGLNRGSRALQSTAKPLVLGLDKAGLTGFAEKIGGTHLMKSQNPGLDFLAAVSDKSQKFVVRLDGLNGSTPKEMFNNAASRGAMSDALGQMGKGGNRTNWELHKLRDAGRLADTTFTLGDDVVKID